MNLKVLRTDRGREYLSEQFKRICEDKGIIRHLTIPYTPQQNGVPERRNRTLLEMARSMMAQANLPISFWGDAILTASYILNRVPSKSIPSTPYELWHGRKPNLEGLRHGGRQGYVMYGEYPNKGMTEIESRDVDFLEEDFPSISEVKGILELYELRDPQGGASIIVERETPRSYPVIDGDNESDPKLSGSCSLEEHNSQDPQMRRSKRGGIPRRRYEIEGESFMCASVDIDEPATYEEAVTSPNANEWITAMKEEMSSIAKNNVWELVDLPTGRKTIGNKWVLKVKRKADGSIDKFKARLVAKGYTQKEGIDYEETFSPVHFSMENWMKRSIWINLKVSGDGAKAQGMPLETFHYGLKQSSRQWYYRFHRAITSIGFTMIEEDHCVSGSSTFEMKDMGEAEYILGVKIHRDRSKKLLSLSQETYIKRIIERFRMHNANPVDTPMDKNCVLSKELCPQTEEEKKRMTKIPYASAVGSLMYAMMCTRPDLCFAVGMVSRYQSNPGPDHWVAVKRILRYLKGTSNLALSYHGGSLRLVGYSDADGSADRDERKSTSGYAFLLGGAAITWSSKKQPCISLSTMEAEYVASAIAYAKDPKYHGRTKHIDTRYHFIRDSIAQGEVVLRHIPMIADPFTKPLRRDAFHRHALIDPLTRAITLAL
ncbi:Retrovirus-related Pol polyprotein from transposon TNT 1-94 [Sesamum angolense]|uniref:Retrovirus-related Pol polyprotein from transposon TNT 1-94 n=1 Tax=Sesamum angolense TaxID=2727404 RepID=A0AAE1W0I8_9LAMI|nr:Retrovirus-related Pol polyprotein from transposon TNT 1-94 [Sesamum angolense]